MATDFIVLCRPFDSAEFYNEKKKDYDGGVAIAAEDNSFCFKLPLVSKSKVRCDLSYSAE